MKIEYLIDTNVLFEHLTKNLLEGESFLIRLMNNGICFTTVLNATELMLKADNAEEENIFKSLLSALKVLGIHPRYCLGINQLKPGNSGLRDSLFLVTAEMNKLDIITFDVNKYKSEKINIYNPEQLSL